MYRPKEYGKGIDFVHFGLESDMVFEGTIQECMNVYVVSIPSGYRKEETFLLAFNLSNGDIIS